MIEKIKLNPHTNVALTFLPDDELQIFIIYIQIILILLSQQNNLMICKEIALFHLTLFANKISLVNISIVFKKIDALTLF